MKDKKLLKKKIEEKPMIDLLQSTRTPNCLNDSNIRKSTRPNWLLERRKKKTAPAKQRGRSKSPTAKYRNRVFHNSIQVESVGGDRVIHCIDDGDAVAEKKLWAETPAYQPKRQVH